MAAEVRKCIIYVGSVKNSEKSLEVSGPFKIFVLNQLWGLDLFTLIRNPYILNTFFLLV